MKITVAVAEDDPKLARSIQAKLGIFESVEMLFIASNGREMLDKLASIQPDIILMDINMPILNGIEATALVRKKFPQIKVIMHTVFDEDDKVFESILAGASGYLLKDEKPAVIENGLKESMEGGAPMSPSIAAKVLGFIRGQSHENQAKFQLTKRETQILQRIGKGENYRQIAEVLFISPKTVRKHIENIYEKLHVHTKVDAVTVAIKNKLISP